MPADKEFLKELRTLCDEKGILLIFDEVITGFRLAPGGAQQYLGVMPDITVLGKILGGGFPIGAVCGGRGIMEKMDTLVQKRPNYSFLGGTFTGNPITMTAGLKTLEALENNEILDKLNKSGDRIRERLSSIFRENGVSIQVTGAGSIFNVHFTREEVKDARAVARADRSRLLEYNLAMIEKGIFFLPTHCGVLSAAHSEDEIEKLFERTEEHIMERARKSSQ